MEAHDRRSQQREVQSASDPVYRLAVCFSAIIDTILLYTTVAVVPMPPDVEKTKGEKDPCSISLTRSSYARLFSISFRR